MKNDIRKSTSRSRPITWVIASAIIILSIPSITNAISINGHVIHAPGAVRVTEGVTDQQIIDQLKSSQSELVAAQQAGDAARAFEIQKDIYDLKIEQKVRQLGTGWLGFGGINNDSEYLNLIKARRQVANQQKNASSNPNDKIPDVCGTIDPGCGLVRAVVSMFHSASRLIGENILRLANILFNQVFDITVRNFKTYGGGTAVQQGWTISRDLVNISLIFVLIYAALGLILRADSNQKKIVANVIVVALLVNFSAMLTGIVIDASNIVANQFYEMAGKASKGTAAYSAGKAPDITTVILERTLTGTNASRLEEEVKNGTSNKYAVLAQVFMNDLFNLPFFLITTIVLVAGALMFFVRMLTLIFLLMLAPLAFLAWAIPNANKYFSKWLNKLVSNAIFAPAFFFMFMITIMALGGGKDSLGGFGGKAGADDTSFVQNLIYLIMVNGMMVGSLLVAKEFGAYGASGAMGVLKKSRGLAMRGVGGASFGLAGRFGRGTVGRWASSKADSEELQKRAAAGGMGGFVARQQLKAYRGVAGSSFDVRATGAAKAVGLDKSLGTAIGKGGYTKTKEESAKREEKFAESLGDVKGADGKSNKDRYLENLAKRGGFGFGVIGAPTGAIATGAAAGMIAGPVGAVVGGIIGGIMGNIAGRRSNISYNQQVVDKVNHTKEKETINKNNAQIDAEIAQYKIDNDYDGKKKAAHNAEGEVKTARATAVANRSSGGGGIVLETELRAAQERELTTKEQFEAVKTWIKDKEKKKTTYKKKEPPLEELLKEALKKEREEAGGSGKSTSVLTPASTPTP